MESQETLPFIPMRDVVVFPHMMIPFIVGRQRSIRAFEHALSTNRRLFLATQRDAAVEEPQSADVHAMGCIANVIQTLKLPDGTVRALVEGVNRAKVVEWKTDRGVLLATVNILPRGPESGDEAQMSRVRSLFDKYVKLVDNLSYDAMINAVRVDDPSKLADTIAAHLSISVDEKQILIEIVTPADRLARLEEILAAEVEKLRTSPQALEQRKLRNKEQRRLLRHAVKRTLESSDLLEDVDRILRAVLTIQSKVTRSAIDEDVFRERGLSSTGIEQIRKLLESHDLTLDIADRAVRSLIQMLQREEDGEARSSLRSVSTVIQLFRDDAATVWTRFGIERKESN